MRGFIDGLCAALIFVLIGMHNCAAHEDSGQPAHTNSGQMSVNQARARYANKTHMTFSSDHGTQVEYMQSDGASFLWYPGNAAMVPGHWKIEAGKSSSPLQICFRYGTNTYNPSTHKRGGEWECGPETRQNDFTVERADGDVFNLAKTVAVPFVLSRDRTTIGELLSRH
jgi:hypothetical protein